MSYSFWRPQPWRPGALAPLPPYLRHCTVDQPSSVQLKIDFTASRLQTDIFLCTCTSGSVESTYL